MEELKKGDVNDDWEQEDVEEIASWILKSAIRVYVITLQCGHTPEDVLEAMDHFERLGFADNHLPIEDPKSEPTPSRHEAFENSIWGDFRYGQFFDKQWHCLAPVFHPGKYTYDLSAQCIMPFEKSSAGTTGGAFSSVYRVRVHRDHQKHVGFKDVRYNSLSLT